MRKSGWVRRLVELLTRFELIRWILFKYCEKRYERLIPVHPFDVQHSVRTSGFLPGFALPLAEPDKDSSASLGYLGVQPSILRRTLNMIPDHDRATFLDLGCGKGRALVVASEFPFRSIIGVEISPELVHVAEKNARVIAQKLPERTSITVVEHNALDYDLPAGNLIVFLYNPFGEYLIRRILTKVENALSGKDIRVWIIYLNPVWGDAFDEAPALSRICADCVPYDSREMGFGPDCSDVVVVWQDAKSVSKAPEGVNRRIVVTDFGRRAELAD